MASTFESNPASTSPGSKVIQQQLDLTRWHVRLVELGAAAVAWIGAVLLYLLIVAIIDHWIWPLGVIGRSSALLLLIAGTGAFIALILWPLLRREINPVYAARAIEDSVPSLKNSLVNFLLLRKDPTGIKEAVLSAVEQRAAVDIAKVPVDLAVDRTKVIRLGYVLLAIVILIALYKIRSPKDPFQSIARVFAPWAKIDRPARVAVSDIEPGDIKVYHGQTVNVRCTVLGLKTNESVKVIYSSLDGQITEKEVNLKPSSVGTRFEAELPAPASAENGRAGIRQDMIYRLVAGDFVSRDYRISVTTAPTMNVERVTYDFKPYTRKPQKVVTGQGDLQALEGTRVTIQARANQPIASGFLELDPPAEGRTVPAEQIPLQVDGDVAQAAFTLQLLPDRQTPWRSSYQLRYTTKTGERNVQPIVHRIDVTPDLAPEIEWLTPERPRVEVRLDGMQLLELRAVDPDFGLKGIKLSATRGDQKLFEKSLLSAVVPPPQANVRFEFRPAELDLEEGDEVSVWGTAEDGRVAPLNDAADPNRTKSSLVTLKITPPADKGGPNKPNSKPGEKPNEKQPNDPQPNKPGEKPEATPNSAENPMKNSGGEENSSQNGGKKEDGGKKPDAPMPGEKGSQGEQSGGKGAQSGGSGGSPQESQNGGDQDGSGSQSSSKNNQGSKGGSQQSGDSSDGNSDDGANNGGSQAGKQGGKSGKSGDQQPSGNDPGNSADSAGGSNSQGSSGEGSENGKPHDGEVFDKVLEQLKKQGKEPKAGKQGKGAGDPQAGEQGNEGGKPQDGASQKGSSPKSNSGNNAAGKNGSQPQPNGNDPAGNNAERNSNDMNPGGTKADGDQPQPMKGGQEDSTSGDGKSKDGDKGDNSKPGSDPDGKESSQGNNDPTNKGPKPTGVKPGEARPGDRPAGDQTPDKSSGNPNPQGKKPGLEDKNLGNGGQQKPAPGEGGAPQKNPQQNPKEGPKPGESGADANAQKDPGAGDNGTPGAGTNSKDPMGSGPSEQANRDKPKTSPQDGPKAEKGEPSPPGQGKKQSDSKGGESGDRNGGGKQGSGQSGGQEGNDSAGSKSSADQGAGKANDPGKGETGTKGGNQEKTDQKTGTAGNDPGSGSQSKPNSDGKNKEGQSDEPGEGSPTDKQPNSENGGAGTGKGKKGQVVAGGSQGNSDSDPSRPDGAVPDGDAANLKYAQEATDLVIDHLKDQEHNPDPALLKQLGWTKDDLSQFLRRWENLKQGTDQADAKKQLDESLRSLGLRPPQNNKRTGGTVTDKVRDLQDAGSRSAPPNRYRDQFDAFRKGVGRSPAAK